MAVLFVSLPVRISTDNNYDDCLPSLPQPPPAHPTKSFNNFYGAQQSGTNGGGDENGFRRVIEGFNWPPAMSVFRVIN